MDKNINRIKRAHFFFSPSKSYVESWPFDDNFCLEVLFETYGLPDFNPFNILHVDFVSLSFLNQSVTW